MKVLGFETSCDETSCALLRDKKILANITTTHLLHREYGGIIPEFASRAHLRLIGPSLEEVLKIAGIPLNSIDLIAATQGPGLIGALLVGFMFAKSLAKFLKKPFIGVDHLEAHLFSIFLRYPQLAPPLLFLAVSGGHTELFTMDENYDIDYIGGTLDDAGGEAFDKGAKLLGFSYPGGPKLAQLSENGDPKKFWFPRAKVDGPNFSFSGLKTSLLYFLQDKDKEFIEKEKANICASYQEAIIDSLISKTLKIKSELRIGKLAVVGGVSANKRLQKKFKEILKNSVYFPEPQLTGDNACMIAFLGQKLYEKGITTPFDSSPYTTYPFYKMRKKG